MSKRDKITTYTPVRCEDKHASSYCDDLHKAPDAGTVWSPCISELLHITVQETAMPGCTENIEYYILKNIEKIPKDAILLFVGNKKIAITGWCFEQEETYYEKEWFTYKDAACFVYDGRNIYLLYADYVGLWNKGKYLRKL
jgi:hypothetical protein